jgi:predicted PurR-regulated permease PerM
LIIAFSLSPIQGILVLILHLVYQQVENAVICPAIYNKALNLYPALGFLAVLIGASLFGILGAFLALPIAASIPVIVNYHESYKQRHHKIINNY